MRASSFCVVLLAGVLLAGCSTFDGWFGEPDDPPLPGERIAILVAEAGVEPDRMVADRPVNLPPAERNGAWPQPGGNAAHAPGHLAFSDSPRVAWTASVGQGTRDDAVLLAQPVVADGRVYTMDARSRVSAFDAASGRRVWQTEVRPSGRRGGYFGGGVAYDGGRVYVTTGFGSIFALDAATGNEIWETRIGVPMRAGPAVAQGRVVATTLNNEVVAVAADDGRVVWEFVGIEEGMGLVGGASPAISGQTVVAPFSSGEVVGMLLDNGRELWSDTLMGLRRTDQASDIAHIRGMPVIDRGLVLAASNSGRMAAIDHRRGLIVWDQGIGSIEMPLAAGDYVFLLTTGGELVALTRDEGRVRWVAPLPRWQNPESERGRIRWTGPVLGGGHLIVAGSHGELLLLSPSDGSVRNRVGLPGPVSVPPSLADGTLYVVTDRAQLVALR